MHRGWQWIASLVLMALVVTPVLAHAQGEGRPIPLDEAVRLARRNAPAAVQARNQIRSTSATVRTRYSAFLPTLSFGGGALGSQMGAMRGY